MFSITHTALLQQSQSPIYGCRADCRGSCRKYGNLCLTKLLASLSHGTEQSLPVLEIGGENLRDHATCKFRHQAVQRHRRITHLIGEPRPVEIVRVPGLGHQSARVSRERREWLQVEQLARITLRQGLMRHAEISRQPIPTQLVGILATDSIEFLSCGSPGVGIVRKVMAKLSCQIEGVGRSDECESFVRFSLDCKFQARGVTWQHALRENTDHFCT